VDDSVQGCGDLTVDGFSGKACGAGQCFQAGWDIGGGIRVEGAASAFVTGVKRGQEIYDLRTANLADDEPVWAHPEGLSDEIPERDATDAFEVGRAGFEADHVRVSGAEFGGVFHEQEAFSGGCQREHGGQEGGLACSRAASDQEGEAGSHDRA
jgi:hypothetical protein